jgi:hypothetical protein
MQRSTAAVVELSWPEPTPRHGRQAGDASGNGALPRVADALKPRRLYQLKRRAARQNTIELEQRAVGISSGCPELAPGPPTGALSSANSRGASAVCGSFGTPTPSPPRNGGRSATLCGSRWWYGPVFGDDPRR